MVQVVYRDEYLLVLDKPSGLLAVPGRGPDLQDCLSARAQVLWPGALVVHRLDRDTSGLMVMALDPDMQRRLSRQFAEREVEKQYIAVVAGAPFAEQGRIELPLRKDFEHPPRHCVDPIAGKPATTEWRVMERQPDRARLSIRAITGRSHQIRVHLAALGHPILGDNLYAPADALTMASRLMLHATRVALSHPAKGRAMLWTSEAPF